METGTHEKSKTSLFFIEFMIALAFFSVAAAICVSIFVSSHLQSKYSEDLSWAAIATQNAAEVYKAVDGDISRMATVFRGDVDAYERTLTVRFNQAGDMIREGEAYYLLCIANDNTGIENLKAARIFAYRGERLIMEIEASKTLGWKEGSE